MACLEARFECGDEVRVVRNIRNDGSFGQLNKGELLVEQGDIGYVRDSGYFLQDQIIFQVFFPRYNKVIGIRDSEVIDASLDWQPCLYRISELAPLAISLKSGDEIIASKGDEVEIAGVTRDLSTGVLEYKIILGDDWIRLPARALSDRAALS